MSEHQELQDDAKDLLDKWDAAATNAEKLLVASDMASLLAAIPDYLEEGE